MTDLKEHFEQGRAALNRGLQARAQGRIHEALDAYRASLQHLERSRQTGACIVALNNLAEALHATGNLEAAADAYRDAMERAEASEDAPRTALTCGNFGSFYLDRGDLTRARIFVRRALDLYTRLGDSAGRANQLGNLGLIAHSKGELEQARTHLGEATGAFLSSGNFHGAGRTLLRLGEIAREEGDPDTAVHALLRARDLLQEANDLGALGYALRSLGQVSLRTGNTEEARAFFSQGRELHKSMQDLRGESAALIDLSNVQEQEGAHLKALETRQEALKIAKTSGSREAHASAELSLSSALRTLGRLSESSAAIERAHALYSAIEMDRGVAQSLLAGAATLRLQGEAAQSQQKIEEARKIIEKRGFSADLAVVYGSLAAHAERAENSAETRDLLTLTAKTYTDASSPSGAHRARLMLLRLDTLSNPSRDLTEALQDERITLAETFYRHAGDLEGLQLVKSVEALLQRAHGDQREAENILSQEAQSAAEQGRTLDAHAAWASLQEIALGRDPGVLAEKLEEAREAAGEARERGALPLAFRLDLLVARGLQGAEGLTALQTLESALPQGDESARTRWMDAKTRLLLQTNDREGALALGDQTCTRYEQAGDLLSASALRAALVKTT